MQCNVIKSFRQRLVRSGFTDISIYDLGYGKYYVRCIDCHGNHIQRKMTLTEIKATPRLVWFD